MLMSLFRSKCLFLGRHFHGFRIVLESNLYRLHFKSLTSHSLVGGFFWLFCVSYVEDHATGFFPPEGEMELEGFLEKYTRIVLSIAGICSVSCFLVWVVAEAYHSIHQLIVGLP
jgi:hypothetical protein